MVLAALSWAVFAVLSTLVMRPFVRLSASSPEEAIAYDVTYGRIVCIGSLGAFLEGIWSKVHQAGCRHASAAAELQLCGAEVRALPRDGT